MPKAKRDRSFEDDDIKAILHRLSNQFSEFQLQQAKSEKQHVESNKQMAARMSRLEKDVEAYRQKMDHFIGNIQGPPTPKAAATPPRWGQDGGGAGEAASSTLDTSAYP
eukprot:6512571-Prorocentrum_lima.AAC.1